MPEPMADSEDVSRISTIAGSTRKAAARNARDNDSGPACCVGWAAGPTLSAAAATGASITSRLPAAGVADGVREAVTAAAASTNAPVAHKNGLRSTSAIVEWFSLMVYFLESASGSLFPFLIRRRRVSRRGLLGRSARWWAPKKSRTNRPAGRRVHPAHEFGARRCAVP